MGQINGKKLSSSTYLGKKEQPETAHGGEDSSRNGGKSGESKRIVSSSGSESFFSQGIKTSLAFSLSCDQLILAMEDLIRIHDMEFALILDLVGLIRGPARQKFILTESEIAALSFAILTINKSLDSFESRWVEPNISPDAG